MSINTIKLDYFLYDNQTESQYGRDWGLKAATGRLAARKDLKEFFYSYCQDTFETSPGSLAGFKCALGGFPDAHTGGYILCVTFEKPDLAGRSSLAVVGLYFPSTNDLKGFLELFDPLETAKRVYDEQTPPSQLEATVREFKEEKISALYQQYNRLKEQGRLYLDRFKPCESYELSQALLLYCCQKQQKLPAILGVTSIFRIEEYLRLGFDVVFCSPKDQTIEAALNSFIENPPYIPGRKAETLKSRDFREKAGTSPYRHKQNRIKKQAQSPHSLLIVLFASAILIIIILAMVLTQKDSNNNSPAGKEKKSPVKIEDKVPENLLSHNMSHYDIPANKTTAGEQLEAMKTLLNQLEALNPLDLKETQAYKIIISVDVLPEFQKQRTELKRILEQGLPVIKQKILDLNISYYFSKDMQDIPEEKRLEKIKSLIKESGLNTQYWETLKTAFGYEFNIKNGILPGWYDILTQFTELGK